MNETWLDVKDFPGYSVSDHGNVRSTRVSDEPRAMHPTRVGNGYLAVTVRTDGRTVSRYVHTLVARAFHGEPTPGQEVRHLDGVQTNNRADNLAWGTRAENMRDAVAHGSHPQTRKTHCPQGHPYEGANLRLWKSGQGDAMSRRCATCRRDQHQARKARA